MDRPKSTGVPLIFTKKFDDSLNGVIAMLSGLSNLDLSCAQCLPDPEVRGVWKVTTPECTVIAYMAGYPNPWGEIRETNDFEEIEVPVEADFPEDDEDPPTAPTVKVNYAL